MKFVYRVLIGSFAAALWIIPAGVASAQPIDPPSSSEPTSPIADLRQTSAGCTPSALASGVNVSDQDLTVSLEWYDPNNYVWELVTVNGWAEVDNDYVFTDGVAKVVVPASSGGYAHSFSVAFDHNHDKAYNFRLVYALEQQAENASPKMAYPSFESTPLSPEDPACVPMPAI